MLRFLHEPIFLCIEGAIIAHSLHATSDIVAAEGLAEFEGDADG